jgi:hypothetical protein
MWLLGKGLIDIAAAPVAAPDGTPRSGAGFDDACDVKSSRSRARATARPSQLWRGSSIVRYTLPAGFVVAVCVALLGQMLSPPSLQPTNTVTMVEMDRAPKSAPNPARRHRDALAVAHVPTQAPNATSPAEHNPAAGITPAPNPARHHKDALAAHAPVLTPNATPPAELSDRNSGSAHSPERSAPPSPEQDALQSPVNERRGAVQPKARITPQRHGEPAAEHLARSTPPNRKPTSEAPAGSAGQEPSVPQRLLLARTALVNGNQPAARSLMEEVQTMIVFQPESVPSRRSTAAASQITAALVMLGRGNEVGALQCLNEAIASVSPA